jgi:hypothetical protein
MILIFGNNENQRVGIFEIGEWWHLWFDIIYLT